MSKQHPFEYTDCAKCACLERQLAEARGKLDAVRELHVFDCTIVQACLVLLDDIDAILGEKGA